MPFRTTDTLPANPPLKIFFHGLTVLRSPDGLSCVAELHRDANTHTLTIEVRTKAANKPDMILLRHLRKLTGNDPLSIKVTPPLPDHQRGAFKYEPFELNPFTTAPDPANPANALNFGWIVNLESVLYHGPSLGVRRSGTRPAILIDGGDCRFYTASLMPDYITVTQGGGNARTLNGLAAIIGANLYLGNDGVERVIEITGPSLDDDLPLPRPDAGVSYEIYVENSPLLATNRHDELEEYYNVIRKHRDDSGVLVSQNERFSFTFPNVPNFATGSVKVNTRTASARIPCMSVALDPP
jgi:hypothetical protein